MPYTDNVPQANQTIASTTDPIRNNFLFLETDLQVEHSFNGNIVGVAEGAHKQCSMQSQPLAPTLPTGTDGMYYVNGTDARYYERTTDFLLSIWTGKMQGTWTCSSSFTTIATLSANLVGLIFLNSSPASGGTGIIGTFITGSSNCYAYGTRMKYFSSGSEYSVQLKNTGASGFALQGMNGDVFPNLTYNYTIVYRPI